MFRSSGFPVGAALAPGATRAAAQAAALGAPFHEDRTIRLVGEAAEKDDSTATRGTSSILLPLLDNPAPRVDPSRFDLGAGTRATSGRSVALSPGAPRRTPFPASARAAMDAPIAGPGPDSARRPCGDHRLRHPGIAEIDAAPRQVHAAGKSIGAMTAADFPLSAMAGRRAHARGMLEDAPGLFRRRPCSTPSRPAGRSTSRRCRIRATSSFRTTMSASIRAPVSSITRRRTGARHLPGPWLPVPDSRAPSPAMGTICQDRRAGAVRGGFSSRSGACSGETAQAPG